MTTIPLRNLPGSALLHAWLERNPSLVRHFPTTTIDRAFCETRRNDGAARSRLRALVEDGLRTVEMSEAQRASLHALAEERAVVTVTGQQIGMFGGPFYTLLKIASNVALARELTTTLDMPVVPVFWLEDNDHDAHEAATAVLQQPDGLPVEIPFWDGDSPRIPVAQRTFGDDIAERLAPALAMLNGQDADNVREVLTSIYRPGTAWNDAFVRLLQPMLGAWGVLVVRGSDVIRHGLHLPVLLKELSSPGAVRERIDEASAALKSDGYHAQIQGHDVNVFIHDDEGRRRPTTEEAPAMMDLAAKEAHRFSPSVVIRPVIQDAVLPSVATVLGPAELAYHAQLGSVYEWFGIRMPMPVLRHTATLIDARTQRLLERSAHEASWFMRPWPDVERDVVAILDTNRTPPSDEAAPHIAALLDPYRKALGSLDPTLLGSVNAAEANIVKALDQLDGKMRSAVKRVNGEILDRYRWCANTIYPFGAPQERAYSLGVWLARFGTESLRNIAGQICSQDRTVHTIING